MLVASPGAKVSDVNEFHLTGGSTGNRRVWATRAANDPIAMATDYVESMGNDPMDDDFRARRFDSAPGDKNPHSEYWAERNPSREAIGQIIAGRADCGFLSDTYDPQLADLNNLGVTCDRSWR